jgi:hypothetical protein
MEKFLILASLACPPGLVPDVLDRCVCPPPQYYLERRARHELCPVPSDALPALDGVTPTPQDPGTTVPGGGSPPNTPSGAGNPGNAKPVGKAGEKGMDNENPSTGTKGNKGKNK